MEGENTPTICVHHNKPISGKHHLCRSCERYNYEATARGKALAKARGKKFKEKNKV